MDDYPLEVEQLFKKAILSKAATAKNRSHYERICDLITQLRYECGEDVANEMVEELIELYPHKRAFIDLLYEV